MQKNCEECGNLLFSGQLDLHQAHRSIVPQETIRTENPSDQTFTFGLGKTFLEEEGYQRIEFTVGSESVKELEYQSDGYSHESSFYGINYVRSGDVLNIKFSARYFNKRLY